MSTDEDDQCSTDCLNMGPNQEGDHTCNDTWRIWWSQARSSRAVVIMVVALALFTDMILYDVIVPILPAILRRVNQDESMMGILLGIYAAGLLLFTPVFGIWSDRMHSRKAPMLLGQMGLGLSTLLFIYRIAAAASWTVGLALLADTFPAGELGWAMGLVFGFNTLGYFVGPLMGGILTSFFSLETPFYICAGFAALDFAGRLFVKPRSANLPNQHTADVSIFTLLGNTQVIAIGTLMAFSAASFAAIETLLALHLERRYGMDSLAVSVVMLAFIIPSILFSMISGYWADIFDHWMLMLVGLIAHAPSPLLLAFSSPLVLFLCSAAYYSASSAIMVAASMPEMGAIVDRLGSTSYAKIYAVTNIFYASGMLGGPIFAYFFSGENSFKDCLICVSVLMLLYIPIFLIVSKWNFDSGHIVHESDLDDPLNECATKRAPSP